MFVSTFCAAQEGDAPAVPPPPADATAMVAFVVILVAMIAGYVWWIRRQIRKQRENAAANGHEA